MKADYQKITVLSEFASSDLKVVFDSFEIASHHFALISRSFQIDQLCIGLFLTAVIQQQMGWFDY